ncbi:enolase-like protein [Palleronia aestuarii]|uniref:Enolase-like protein n=1 Tax=Palleronia aestuarii TaxID=568105 RepID=A0A2W7N9I0_9RHOB|nr:enolase C-terminal domain-like protein [Palleronia aestuarii]PZX17065.1 enolase-like protein [Palleronia aestuarii]
MTRLRILAAEWEKRTVTMRLPFQFGTAVMHRTGEAWCRVTALVDGREITGRSAQLMVPRWFDKRLELSAEDTIGTSRESVRVATQAIAGQEGPLPALARELRVVASDRMPAGTPPLAAGFGPALVEMALIDAVCRAAEVPFWRAARDDLFDLAAHLPADLSRQALAASLQRIGPPRSARLRHTIGFDAPLVPDDVAADAPRDGLPVCLAEVIAAHGITAFKIKLKGDPAEDLNRLRRIATLLAPVTDRTVTLDANEQYAPEAFDEFLAALAKDRALAPIRDALRFVEQPFDRTTALSGPVPDGIGVPLVIDESDDHDDAFAEALDRGWAGTSIKSCKGVLRALLNAARAREAEAILSAEDLTCQPGLAWQQDTAMASACGVPDMERNGHHFAGGMQGAPDDEVTARLAVHDDIYKWVEDRPALGISEGRVTIRSLDQPGFGGI